MILKVACSYCRTINELKIANTLEVRQRSALLGGPFKCHHCGSGTQIEIKTIRRGKGKGQKVLEAAAAEQLVLNLAAARAKNAKIGAELLEDPLCTCAERIAREGDNRGHVRAHGEDGGHPLSTGWSRDDKRGGLMPTRPQHFHHCPARKRSDDRRLQEQE